jgi:hypothetical protein
MNDNYVNYITFLRKESLSVAREGCRWQKKWTCYRQSLAGTLSLLQPRQNSTTTRFWEELLSADFSSLIFCTRSVLIPSFRKYDDMIYLTR